MHTCPESVFPSTSRMGRVWPTVGRARERARGGQGEKEERDKGKDVEERRREQRRDKRIAFMALSTLPAPFVHM